MNKEPFSKTKENQVSNSIENNESGSLSIVNEEDSVKITSFDSLSNTTEFKTIDSGKNDKETLENGFEESDLWSSNQEIGSAIKIYEILQDDLSEILELNEEDQDLNEKTKKTSSKDEKTFEKNIKEPQSSEKPSNKLNQPDSFFFDGLDIKEESNTSSISNLISEMSQKLVQTKENPNDLTTSNMPFNPEKKEKLHTEAENFSITDSFSKILNPSQDFDNKKEDIDKDSLSSNNEKTSLSVNFI